MSETGSGLARGRKRGRVVALLVMTALIVWIEARHNLPGFRAWTFGLVFLIAAVLTSLVPARLRDAGLVVTTLLLGLCVLEIAASIIAPRSDVASSPSGLTGVPDIGWGAAREGVIPMREYNTRTGATIFEAQYTIDKDLDRVVKSTSDGPAVVFFGDSFTFGVGVNDADTLPQLFADLYDGRHRVVNLGVTGFAPSQFLREVETGMKDAVIGPDPTAFVFLTSPFHAMRTACKETWVDESPRYAMSDGHAVYQGKCRAGVAKAWNDFLEHTAIYRVAIRPFVVKLTHADIDLYIKILADAVATSKAKYGADTVIPFVPAEGAYLAGTGYDNASIIARMREAGLNVVNMPLTDDRAKGLVYTIAGDGHPTGAANKIRARMLADALHAAGKMPAPRQSDGTGAN